MNPKRKHIKVGNIVEFWLRKNRGPHPTTVSQVAEVLQILDGVAMVLPKSRRSPDGWHCGHETLIYTDLLRKVADTEEEYRKETSGCVD